MKRTYRNRRSGGDCGRIHRRRKNRRSKRTRRRRGGNSSRTVIPAGSQPFSGPMPHAGDSRSLPATLRRHISNMSERISRKMPRIREKIRLPERLRRRRTPREAPLKMLPFYLRPRSGRSSARVVAGEA